MNCPFLALSQNVANPIIIVVDPGHGGKDNGTCGHNSKEKNITLAIAKKLDSLFEYNNSNIDIVLTRKDDSFLRLRERTKIANDLKAELFLSIHCNHIHIPSIKGTEVYIMGLSKSDENLEIVKRENSVIGFEENSDESHIMNSLCQLSHITRSAEIAQQICVDLRKKTPLVQRGVKQAGFSVLKTIIMPGALLETAYLSNPEDEKYVLGASGQLEIAQGIYQAIVNSFPANNP